MLEKVLRSLKDVEELEREDCIKIIIVGIGSDEVYSAVVEGNNTEKNTLIWVYRDNTGFAVEQSSTYDLLNFEHGGIRLSQKTKVIMPSNNRESLRSYRLLEMVNL